MHAKQHSQTAWEWRTLNNNNAVWAVTGSFQWTMQTSPAKRRLSDSAQYAYDAILGHQSINIRLLRHDKMQANNSKQKGNTVIGLVRKKHV